MTYGRRETVAKLVKENINEKQKIKEQKMKNIIFGAIAAVVCICFIAGIIIAGNGKKSTTSTQDSSDIKDTLVTTGTSGAADSANGGNAATGLDASLTYYADIEIEDYGTIIIQLDQESAPITTENFVNLAESGFYDGLTFHRIMENFMMQGGDPLGNGTGGSDTTIVGEFSANGYDNNLSHTRGAVSMARSNKYDSASSQFFIVHEDSTFLDGQYAVFGYVTEGMEIVDAICEAAQPIDGNGTILSADQPVITSIAIRTE